MNTPALNPGETYIGRIADHTGIGHHIIRLPGDNDDATWQEQMDWANLSPKAGAPDPYFTKGVKGCGRRKHRLRGTQGTPWVFFVGCLTRVPIRL